MFKTNVKIMPSVMLALLVGFAIVLRGTAVPSGENMLRNPGFEDSANNFRPWGGRNWWSRTVRDAGGNEVRETNEFAFSLDTENPHSGSNCMKISLTKLRGGDLQFLQGLPQIKAGMSLRLSFWIRGHANSTAPLNVVFRRDAHPWTHYFRARIERNEKWRQHVFNITIPDNVPDNGKIALMFNLREEDEFWLDDFELSFLPTLEPGGPLADNQLFNGSFEVGRDRWYATFRESSSLNTIKANDANVIADIQSVEIADAPEGKRALSFEVFSGARAELTSAFFPLRYGYPSNIEFSFKNESGRRVNLDAFLLCGEFPNTVVERKRFTFSGTDWQRGSFKVTPHPSSTGTYTLGFGIATPGKYMLDDIRVWQGDAPASPRSKPEIGWKMLEGSNRANFFAIGDIPTFRILAQAPESRRTVTLTGNVVDAWERELTTISADITLDDRGYGETTLTLPECKLYGGFKVSLKLSGADEPATEILYSVPRELPAPGAVKEPFFGGHVILSPYNLLIAEKAGFRWLRLHPPNDTKWYLIEPHKGALEFYTRGSEMAKKMGFSLMGNLGTVPEFYADKPAGAVHNWYGAYPPRDEAAWQAYERYVRETVKAFAPYIDTWEIGNESDGKFLQVPEGMVREDIYMEYVRRTMKALDGVEGLTIIGGVITGIERPFMGRTLEMGIGDYVDGVSFHHYGPLGKSSVLRRVREMDTWSSYKNRKGQPMPVWHTEGFGATSPTWLRTTGLDFINNRNFTRQWRSAGLNLQSALYFKALGAKAHILYAAYARLAGRIIYRNECAFMTDINGLPLPSLPAHAAMVYFLEGAEPAGGIDWQEQYVRASFVKNGKRIDVVWTEDVAIRVQDVPDVLSLAEKRQLFDMMGNPIEQSEQAVISPAPLYLLEK